MRVGSKSMASVTPLGAGWGVCVVCDVLCHGCARCQAMYRVVYVSDMCITVRLMSNSYRLLVQIKSKN